MIIEKFEQQAAAFPGNIAVKTGKQAITYNQLNMAANRVAHAVLAGDKTEKGGEDGVGQRAALLFQQGADLLTGIIGALKADRVYVPLDVTYPVKRLKYMIEHSGSGLILTNNENVSLAEQLAGQVQRPVSILNIENIGSQYPDANRPDRTPANRPAYILYTSGSTGWPKGVVQTHGNVLYFARNWIRHFSITGSDRMTLLPAVSHDGAVPDIFGALLAGACLYPYSIKTSANANELYSLLKEEKITIWHSVPSVFRYFAGTLTDAETLDDIRWVLLGGEPVRAHDLELFKTYFPKSLLGNIYGQTESTVNSICTISREHTFDQVTIGEPLEEIKIFLVDKDGDMVDDMGVGEIVIASDYLAPGYWRDEQSSAGVFVHDEELGRLYWTGDMGRLTARGAIKITGRKDHQIKIRGFRVETGEIETLLLRHEGVKEAAVSAAEDKNGNTYLCAYLVSRLPIPPGALRNYLSEFLPAYMIPRYFIPLDSMPLTPNGKIDRKELPKVEEADVSGQEYKAPTNETEQKLAAIWREVLAVNRVGIHDNFIELGGHSLLVISIIDKIHQVFNVELQWTDVFANPTVEELSRLIDHSPQKQLMAIQPVEKKEYYIAAPAQKRMFVLNQLEGIGTTYHSTAVRQLTGQLDQQRFEQAVQQLIQRHESFRTSFRMLGQDLVQVVHDEVEFAIEYDRSLVNGHWSLVNSQGRGEVPSPIKVEKIIRDFIRPFDLSRSPLLRVSLIKLRHTPSALRGHRHFSQEEKENKYLLIVDMHHIISDALSSVIFIKDFMALYAGEEPPTLRLQYRDYTRWQNKKTGEEINQQQDFWLAQFPGEIPVLDLPTDYPRPVTQDFSGDVCDFTVESPSTRTLKKIAAAEGATLYMVILSIFNILLAKLSGQDDIIIGTDEAGRSHPDLQHIVGLFVNTLALRNFPSPGKTFRGFLKEVKEKTLQAFANRGYQFEDLVEHTAARNNRDTGRNPLFDVMFSFIKRGRRPQPIHGQTDVVLSGHHLKKDCFFCVLLQDINKRGSATPTYSRSDRCRSFGHHLKKDCFFSKLFQTINKSTGEKVNEIAPPKGQRDGGLKVIPITAANPTSMFDLTLNGTEDEDRLFFSFRYCTKLFKPVTIQRFAAYFQVIVSVVTANCDHKISGIEIITPEERKQVLFDFNNTKIPLPGDKNYCHLFESQRERGPDKLAVLYNDQHITYDELNREANRMARALTDCGVTANTLVPLYLKRNITLLAAIIGVFKAGGAYLPIEPDYPPSRVEYILRDSEAPVMITEPAFREIVHQVRDSAPALKHVLFPDQGQRAGQNPSGDNHPHDLAYIIYTSGTTGSPKGVMIHRLGMLNHIYAKINTLAITAADRIAQTAPVGFDISVWQLLAGLLAGGSICIIDKEIVLEPMVFLQVLQRQGVTILESVPSLISAFLETTARERRKHLYLRWLVPTGELLSVSLVRRWFRHFPGIPLVNAYGPTEASDDVTHYIVNQAPPDQQTSIPIGKPLQNLHVYILDPHLALCPIGVRGEICVAGIGIGKGYWKDPGKTARSFIPNPYLEETGGDRDYALMYKTGDIGYFRQDGCIEFLGRMDSQVKIRGYRIELEEIEQQLLHHDKIKESVAAALENEKGDKYLCAYIVGKEETAPEAMPGPAELKKFLSDRLPAYMVPPYFVTMERIPLTPNGKIDRKALPYPEIKTQEEYIAPRDELEQEMANTWAEVLGIEKGIIGAEANFFELGGHSIKATLLLAKIHQELNVKLPLAEVFKNPTLSGLCNSIRELKKLGQEKYTTIPRAEKKEYYELSPAQKRMYIVQQMKTGDKSYNMPAIVGLKGELESGVEGLTGIFRRLIERHESLRTSFVLLDDGPVQQIHARVEFEIGYQKVKVKVEVEDSDFKGTRADIISSFIRPFDLAKAPLIRVGLIKEGRQQYTLMIDMAHIISDGVSYGIVIKDLMDLYNGKDLPPLKLQYKDFSQWQNRLIRAGKIDKQKTYWLKQFENEELPGLKMPLDYPRPTVRNIQAGDHIIFTLDQSLSRAVRSAAKETGTTPFMILLAAYKILLSKYANQEDIVVGTLLTGRSHHDLQNVIGFFINTLPLRSHPQKDKTFMEFLQEVKEITLGANENQDYAFDELVKELGLQGDSSRNPVFDTVFTLDPLDDIAAAGTTGARLRFEARRSGLKFAKFDLYLEAAVGNETIDILLRYSMQLFKPSTVQRIARYYTEILEKAVKNLRVRLKDITISHDYVIVRSEVRPEDSIDFKF